MDHLAPRRTAPNEHDATGSRVTSPAEQASASGLQRLKDHTVGKYRKDPLDVVSDQLRDDGWKVHLGDAFGPWAHAAAEIGDRVMKALDKAEKLEKFTGGRTIKSLLAGRATRITRAVFASLPLLTTDPGGAEVLEKMLQRTQIQYVQQAKARAGEIAVRMSEHRAEQFQSFIARATPYMTALRAKYGAMPAGSPEARAWRFVCANLFIPYENAISRGGFEDVAGFSEKMRTLIRGDIGIDDVLEAETASGAPREAHEHGAHVPLDDLHDDGTPKQLPIREAIRLEEDPNYIRFKQAQFKIYVDPLFRELQTDVVEDSKELYYYELVTSPALVPPELLEQAREGLERMHIGAVASLVHPRTVM